ncbi:glycosyltransferase family 2 protein [Aeromonas caviae]|uniref:glycosyltransferase family 2 protein n=1 Tax=Aeromonas caviae TaxID=648 RepID=UPI0038CFCF79
MVLNESIVSVCNSKVVTVAVITYNSAETVLDTLNSIASQTYGQENIELIISDDGSKDRTVMLIEEWLLENSSGFFCVKFFANEVNGGISKNCNIAWRAATSEWIKTIAGDDLLVENALTTYMEEVEGNSELKCVFSRVRKFTKDHECEVHLDKKMKRFFASSAEKQYRRLIISNIIYAPTSFINRNVLNEVGYANERYRLIEDLPLWLKLSKSGYRLNIIDAPLVKYRVSESVSRSEVKIINYNFSKEVNSFLFEEVHYLKSEGYIFLACLLYIDVKVRQFYEWIVIYLLKNEKHNSRWARLISIIKFISPFSIVRFFGL